MKNKPILRWMLWAPYFFIAWIFSHVLVFFIYLPRDIIRRGKKNGYWVAYFLWLFLNDTTEGEDAGDFGRYKHNFIGFWKQNARRNGFWNGRLEIAPLTGIAIKIKTSKNDVIHMDTGEKVKAKLVLCNMTKYMGINFVFFTVKETRYFRFSLTRIILRGNRLLNIQFGTDDKRYLYKVKNNKI